MTDPTDSPTSGQGREQRIIPVALFCPNCTEQHIDAGEWESRPHRTHLCLFCGAEWEVTVIGASFIDQRTRALESANAALRAELEAAEAEWDRLRELQVTEVAQALKDAGLLPGGFNELMKLTNEATAFWQLRFEQANKKAALVDEIGHKLRDDQYEPKIPWGWYLRWYERYDALERESGGTP